MEKPYCHFGRYLNKATQEQWTSSHQLVYPHVWNRELRVVDDRKQLGPVGRKLWGEEDNFNFGCRNATDISSGMTKQEQKKFDRRQARRERDLKLAIEKRQEEIRAQQ